MAQMVGTIGRLQLTASFSASARVDEWCMEHMPFLSNAVTREDFFRRIARIFPTLDARYRLIERAYEDAEKAFKNIERDSGIPYFEHLRAVALILIDYLEIRDHEIIIAALLHDIVEDCDDWTIERVREDYGLHVALLVQFLTQPHDDEFGTREEGMRVFHDRLGVAPRDVLVIKFADRIHNLLTLKYRPMGKRMSKVLETEEHYLPLARRELILFPELRTLVYLLKGA